MSALTINSTVRMLSGGLYIPARDLPHSPLVRCPGHEMPRLGFGVFKIPDASACLEAARAGYRHFDSAQYYHNEAAVGQAVRESSIPREQLFVSTYHV
jgi:diketogulonate reductase-like aldo/keto reductase